MTRFDGNYHFTRICHPCFATDTEPMNTPQAPHHIPHVPNTGQSLRVALGPGFQLSGASEKFLREATRRG